MTAHLAVEDSPVASAPASADESIGALRWTATVILVMIVLLALFNAASVRSWAETLPPTPNNLTIRNLAEDWYGVTDRLGLATPRATLRAAWDSARKLTFPAPTEP